MEGSLLPGTVEKVNEYALRIVNGEDPDFVLDGADAFRPLVESAVAQYQEKKKKELEEDEVVSESNPGVIFSEEKIAQREKEDQKNIEVLREDLGAVGPVDPFAHMEAHEGSSEEHKDAVQIYNAFMNIGKGISEGLEAAFDPKVQQYVNEIRSGKTREYVLGGAPKSMVDAVEKELAKGSEENNSEEKGVYIENLEELHSKLSDLSKDYYFLTHQTHSDFAEKINKEDFLFQGGGLNTTTLAQGPDGITLSLKKMEEGESHRNSDSMVIFAVPKKEFKEYYEKEGSENRRFEPDGFSEMLIENKLGEISKSGSLRIPHEYVLGIYEKGKGFLFNK